ncbi:DNA-3-methyladenine glycosylase 2 family protein [soil metagenome]
MVEDFEICYKAASSRDARFDGWFIVAVTSTGIYCRPSCPAITPKRRNVRFYPTAAAAQGAGFRACMRCRPDASPGSPEWDVRADVAGRAMRLINDGLVDREGVTGLAHRLGYTERHLGRMLVEVVGAGPLALARARRAHTARLLVETTDVPTGEVAFAAGFSSIRQFNDTFRAVFATTPRELRRKNRRNGARVPGQIALRLPFRDPFDGKDLLRFLGDRTIPGIEELAGDTYRRTLSLPHGAGAVELSEGSGHVRCALRLEDMRDLGPAVERCRRLLDLDADPVAIRESLGEDPLLGAMVRETPGLRVPGTVDGAELALRAVIGQQVTVADARTLAGRLVRLCGKPLPDSLVDPGSGLTHLFPSPSAVAEAGLEDLGLPGSRYEALRRLARALAAGEVSVDRGADRLDTEKRLLSIKGIGHWTAAYVAMRALGDPDAFLPTDLGVRRAVERLGGDSDPATITGLAERWRPWRSYATRYLWASLGIGRPIGNDSRQTERLMNCKTRPKGAT